MQHNIIAANRDRDLWLTPGDGNCYFIPKDWCDAFSFMNGHTGGIDWDGNNLDHAGYAKGPEIYCYAPTRTHANSPVETLFVEVKDLQAMQEISMTKARQIHPQLAAHLDTINAGKER